MTKKLLPDYDLLHALLRYESITGKLFWKPQPHHLFPDLRQARIWNTKYANKEAFTTVEKGYRAGRINGNHYLAHRVIWKMIHNQEPDQIDHVRGKRSDNRSQKLRDVTPLENSQNQKKRLDNTSGITGVSFNSKRNQWHAYISINKKRVHIGWYSNQADAVIARKQREQLEGFHPNHGR